MRRRFACERSSRIAETCLREDFLSQATNCIRELEIHPPRHHAESGSLRRASVEAVEAPSLRGRDAAQKKKWPAAEKKFQQAVQIYPKFAAAWLELARVQLEQHDMAAARQSLQQSVAADPQFVSPHGLLAIMDFQEQHWQDVLNDTGAVLRLNPLSFAEDWYYNSAANYYLGHYDDAEKAARQGIQTDVTHRIPKLEYLLGVILAQKHNYQGAAEHMRNYVRLAPQSTDVARVNAQIANIEKLSASQAATQK